jgi:hypothetical protein
MSCFYIFCLVKVFANTATTKKLRGIKIETQKASKFALEASATTNAILNKALEIVLPVNYTDIANQKLVQKGQADKIDA